MGQLVKNDWIINNNNIFGLKTDVHLAIASIQFEISNQIKSENINSFSSYLGAKIDISKEIRLTQELTIKQIFSNFLGIESILSLTSTLDCSLILSYLQLFLLKEFNESGNKNILNMNEYKEQYNIFSKSFLSLNIDTDELDFIKAEQKLCENLLNELEKPIYDNMNAFNQPTNSPCKFKIDLRNSVDKRKKFLLQKANENAFQPQAEIINWIDIFEKIDIETKVKAEVYKVITQDQKANYFSKASLNLTMQYLHNFKKETWLFDTKRKIAYINAMNIEVPSVVKSEDPTFNQTVFEAQSNYFEFLQKYKIYLETMVLIPGESIPTNDLGKLTAKHYVLSYILECLANGVKMPVGEKDTLTRIGNERLGQGKGNTFYKNFNSINRQDLNIKSNLVEIGGENWREIVKKLSQKPEELEMYLQRESL